MVTSLIPIFLMLAAVVLTASALVTENAITNQMARSQYRFVGLFRITRRAPFLAFVALAAFASHVIQVLPGKSGFVLLMLSVLIGLVSQFRAVAYDEWADVIRLGLNPWVALGMSASLLLHDTTTGGPALLLAGLVWAQTVLIGRYRAEQDWISIRD